jgi:hypothetical protein
VSAYSKAGFLATRCRADCKLGYDFHVNYERLCIGADGRISAGPDPRRRLIEQPGEYRAYEGPAGAILLTRMAGNANAAGHVLMMGEIVSRTTVVEVINVVTSTNWRGDMLVVGSRGKRVLSIDHGALKHAQTDFEAERLGEILIAAGLLERKELERHLNEKPTDRRLGQLLVERGVLAADELFKQLQRQAEAIFYASLLVESGHYWFVSPPENANAPGPPTTVHVPVQALLMEGVQRIDEMALYRERIPHNRMFPLAADKRENRASLDPTAIALLDRCDGTRSIDDLARLSASGEFQTLKMVYGLLRTGHLQLLAGPTLDTKAAERLVRLFNDIIRDIFLAVATYGKMEHARRSISSWLANGPHTALLGDEVDVDGTLNARVLIRRMEEQGHGGEALKALHQALHELIAYALFTASNNLPRQEEQSLSRDVNHRLKQLQL